VPIVMGSDNGFRELHGHASVSELAHMVGGGMSAIDAIRSATTVAARYLRLEGLGRIAAGQRADLIAVEGDPLEDIEVLRRVKLVVKDGRVVSPQNHPLRGVA
jgi:imidazolonepropionase-like amidohydrolase